MIKSTDCTPPAVNGDPLRVAPSGKPGPGACIPQHRDCFGQTLRVGDVVELIDGEPLRIHQFIDADRFATASGLTYWSIATVYHSSPKATNLDLQGRVVKRGALVSWHGLRFTVSKVRMGTCYPVQPSAAGRFVPCQSVQVVR